MACNFDIFDYSIFNNSCNGCNVAFIGKIDGVGDKGWNLAGIVGEIWKGHANKTYVEADITATKARAAGLASTVDNSSDPNGIGKYGTVRNLKPPTSTGDLTLIVPLATEFRTVPYLPMPLGSELQ